MYTIESINKELGLLLFLYKVHSYRYLINNYILFACIIRHYLDYKFYFFITHQYCVPTIIYIIRSFLIIIETTTLVSLFLYSLLPYKTNNNDVCFFTC